MSDADTAYAKTQNKIAEAARTDTESLNFSGEDFHVLDRLPPEIANLTKLQALYLTDTQVTDLAPLAGLTRLQVLYLNNTQLTDLAPLEGLTRLQTLRLDNTEITDLAPLKGLTRLQTLLLDNTEITDLAPLAGLTRLQRLDLNGTQITDLAPLKGLTWLQDLHLENTQITDLAPLEGMTRLQTLGLESTQITDLRSIAGLDELGTGLSGGPRFQNTPATRRDARLAELAQIKDNEERSRETLAYLRTLPRWPQPYTPAATPDGSTEPVGGTAEPAKLKAAKAQITHLLRNYTATRLTAQQFSSQIRDALQDVPATNGNYLAEPLQTMLEFADELDKLAPQSESATDPLTRANLELRIAQLEALVERLSQQLQDETKARETAEALAGKGLFWRSFKEDTGKQVARVVVWVPSVLICAGMYQAATYYLGVGNPVLEGLSRLIIKAGD